MPRIFDPVDIGGLDKEVQKDFYDRHAPRIECNEVVKAGEKLKVKIIIGEQYVHPDDPDHFISFVQLWNRETFIAEAHFTPGALGNMPNHVEIDFYIVPKVSMNLTALSNCTKHGLWQSESKEVKVIQ
jgi:superoxide reductase